MKYIKHLFVIFVLMPSFSLVRAQQAYTQHFVRDMPQANYSNPSFKTEYRQVVALPSFVYNYGNNAFSYNELIQTDQNGQSFYDVDGVLSNMGANNIMQVQLYSDVLSVYFVVDKWYFTMNMGEKFDLKLSYPKELVDIVWNGNAQYIGQSVDIGPAIDMSIYKNFSVAAGREFDRFSFGFRLNFMNGIMNIATEESEFLVTTGNENYESTLSSDYVVRTSGVDNFINEIVTPYAWNDNLGLGIDLGGRYKFGEKWEVALSVIDLGAIRWNRNVVTYRSNGSFTFEGVDIAEFVDDEDEFNFDDYTDSIQNLYWTEEAGGQYTDYLTPKTYLSATYAATEKTTLGALVQMDFFDGIQPGFALYGGQQFGKFLDLGLSYSIKNRQYTNLGFNLGVGPRWMKFWIVTDNLITFLRAGSGRNVTFRYAININLGSLDKKSKKKAKSQEATE